MKPLSEENLRYLSEKKFETEKSNKFTPKVLRDKMIGKFSSLENKDQRILVVESFEFCEDLKNLGFKNVSFMSDNLDKNKFVKGIYGFETFLLNLKETKNIKFEMKFDKVIMNPPYGKLHLPILKKCVEEFVDIENGGEIVSLQPVRWLQDPLAKYKKNSDALKMQSCLEGRIEDIEIIERLDATKMFSEKERTQLTMNIGIFFIKKSNKYFNYFNENSIIKKIIKHKIFIKNFVEQDKKDGFRATIPFVKWPEHGRYFAVYTLNGLTKNGNCWTEERQRNKHSRSKGSPIPFSIKFNTENELENFINSTKTCFFKYLIILMHIDMSVPNKYLPFMEDYTEPWTDERFYEYFKLTSEEIKTIEDSINSIEKPQKSSKELI